ncbi:MAG: hypothetical protein QNK37_18905 [Acidobacteriota bacterium]|nr:hypothetical protein [Acidobacteriota bacterium]
MKCVLLFCLVSVLPAAAQQDPPPSDIYLADLDETTWSVSDVRDITPLDTYNNQPFFLPDGTLFYTCHVDDQTDIFHYDPASGKAKRLTYSQESEYSPTLMPDGRRFSVIRVEHDGTQRLWVFPKDGGPGEVLLPRVKPVGYHVWVNRSHLAMFILGEPNFLAEIKSGVTEPKRVLDNIGRCLQKIPGRNAYSITQSKGENQWAVKMVDAATGKVSDMVDALPGAADYAWTPSGVMLTAQDSKLFRRKPGEDGDWQLVADLADAGLKGITRLAVSADGKKLALVSAR